MTEDDYKSTLKAVIEIYQANQLTGREINLVLSMIDHCARPSHTNVASTDELIQLQAKLLKIAIARAFIIPTKKENVK